MAIGFIGVGLMGLPLVHRLRQAGYAVHAWSRRPAVVDALIPFGVKAAQRPDEVLQHCDVIITALADDAAHDAVFAGQSWRPGQIVVDHATLSPTLTRQRHDELAQVGAFWLDAPVSGGVVGAEQGRLVVMVGGEAQALDTVRPVLAAYAQRVTHMGPSGAGQVTKLCNQLVVASTSVLIAEMVALAEHGGVDSQQLLPALAGGFADSLPFQLLAPRMARRTFTPVQWRVQTLEKDLAHAVHLAESHGMSVPVARAAWARLTEHARHAASDDLSTLIQGQDTPSC